RLRVTLLDNIARRYPTITIIGAHLGNPDYAWAGEIARWNPNLFFDLSGSTLIKKQHDLTFFKSIFWWSSIASPHTPKAQADAFEKVVFASDIFGGELEELDRSIGHYERMLKACGVSAEAQANIFGGTLWKLLNRRKPQ
ncbi:MAG: amidohydrolase family protein, partial [Bryobacteraceae bacterium]